MIHFKNISMKPKLVGLFLFIGLLPLGLVGWFANQQASEALLTKSFAQLEAVREIRKGQIEDYFTERKGDITVLAASNDIIQGMETFHTLFHRFEKEDKRVGGQEWENSLDKSLVNWLNYYTDTYSYDDLLFIDVDGNVVYSTARESDLGENLIHGFMKDNPLGQTFSKAQQGYILHDFDSYAPADGEQTSFLGMPVKKEGKIIGVIALHIPIEGINAIMRERAGMGITGETYLVGKHEGVTSYRNDRAIKKGKVGDRRDDPRLEEALLGSRGASTYVGSTGRLELFSYAPIEVAGLNWAIIGTIELDEVTSSTQTLIQMTLLMGVALFVFVVALALFIAQTIANPLHRLIQAANQIAGGEWSSRVEVDGTDELGQLAEAFNHMAINNEEQFWIKTNAAEFTSIVQQAKSPTVFAQDLIQKLTPILESGHGVVYVLDKESASYRLLGSYGYTERKNLSHIYAEGEGIVGQCALEQKPIMLTEVPHDHIKITTGLGESTPMAILAVPLVFQNKVLAVIEIASFKRFNAKQRALLDELVPVLGLGFENQDRNQRTELLLKTTQQQAQEMTALAEEMQAQQEELRAANTVMQEKTNALEASEEEMRLQQEELTSTNKELANRTQLLEDQRAELLVSRKEVEQKAKSLAEASRYKSEFLANMSHELRSPLNSLLLLAEDLASNKQGNLDKDQVLSARIVHNSGTDLLNLVNDILDLAKIEAGKVDLYCEALDLATFAQQTKEQFAHLAADKNLSWRVEVAPQTPKTIQTDKRKIGQILKNLVSNALKFTKEGGVTLRIFPASNEWAVAMSVEDSGIGIPEEKHTLIFGAFQQADGTTTRQYGGTGLGLAISQELAKRLGGDIQVKSVEGKGSVFTLFLPEKLKLSVGVSQEDSQVIPQQVEQQEVASVDDQESVSSSNRVVLIIEDDPVFAGFLSRLAQERGFESLVSDTLELGLELAEKHQPAGIILDLSLHGRMDGITLMERLKGNPKTRAIPVHIITGVEDEKVEALAKGAVGYLNKPVSRSQLDEVFRGIEQCASSEEKKLLVIDGDSTACSAIVDLIQSQTLHVSVATTGEEAYKLIKQQIFQCIILNPNLPDMEGGDLLDQIDANAQLVNPVVIIYTDKKLSQMESESLRKYADNIVVKKGGRAQKRLKEEVTLFFHKMESTPVVSAAQSIPQNIQKEAFFKDKTILLVDDDMRNIFALSKILRSKGFTVVAAENGEKSLILLEKNPEISVVLMDIMMPVMDGYQAISEIRKQPNFQKLPIIALTAKAMAKDREKCLKAGANDYLAKPVDVEKLLSLLRVWLSE